MTIYSTIKRTVHLTKLWPVYVVLTGLLAFGLLGVADAYAVSGSIGGRPANPRESNKRTRSIFVHRIEPGNSVNEAVLVVNNSDIKQTVNLYAVDASVTSSGSLTCKQRVEEKKDVGKWISIDKSSVTLEPGKDEVVPFRINVPADGVDVGEHDGCLVIEPVVDEGDGGDGGVRIRTRSAIRVAVTIPGDLKKELALSKFDVRSDKGNYYYDVALNNNGNVSLDADIKVTLTSLFGNTVYSNGGQYPVIPKAQLELTFTDERPPMFGGWYWADASVSYDSSVQNELGVQTNQQIVTKNWDRKLLFVAPTAPGLLVILAVALIVLALPAFLYYRSVQRRRTLMRGSMHVVNPGETIRSIAEHYKVPWKKLATLNKVKAPYDLEVGSTLVIPKKNKPSKKSKPSKKE